MYIYTELFSLPSIFTFSVIVYITILELELNKESYYFNFRDENTESLYLTTFSMKLCRVKIRTMVFGFLIFAKH